MDAREEYQKNIEVMKELRAKLDSVLSNTDEEPSYKQPDPLKHKYISFIKSGFRIAAGFALALGYLQGAGLLLVLAEVLGIAEEMV